MWVVIEGWQRCRIASLKGYAGFLEPAAKGLWSLSHFCTSLLSAFNETVSRFVGQRVIPPCNNMKIMHALNGLPM